MRAGAGRLRSFIVLNDADIDEAVKAAVIGRYQNTGQVCAAAKRFIVEAGIAEAFTQKFVAAAAALKMGDPRDEQNYIGPMARFDLRDELHEQVRATLKRGDPAAGGGKIEGAGNYYADGARKRYRGDDRFPRGAVWPGGDDYRSPRCRSRAGAG